MATKHFFPDTSSLVVRGLESLVAKNPHLALDAANKVVYLPTHSTSKVSVLSGGGAGHEPAWCGYVGQGLLSAAISGEVFASPSTKQIMAAVEKVPSEKGVILCITNYTGDNLHFGLAREKVAGSGRKVGMLRMTDDVGLGREKTSKLGRRGLAGNMFGEFRNTREREREKEWWLTRNQCSNSAVLLQRQTMTSILALRLARVSMAIVSPLGRRWITVTSLDERITKAYLKIYYRSPKASTTRL
jgi:dihydroxyacetone kinase